MISKANSFSNDLERRDETLALLNLMGVLPLNAREQDFCKEHIKDPFEK